MNARSVIRLAKLAALRIPGLRGVVIERDRLRHEMGQLEAARARAQAEADRLAAAHAELRAAYDGLAAAHEQQLAVSTAREAELRTLHEALGPLAPPGHFYSPIPDLTELRAEAGRVFEQWPREVPGVSLNEAQQVGLLQGWVPLYAEQPFAEAPSSARRHRLQNPFFGYCDAIFLYCMLRHLRPKRVIEVGSGHSSCVILDTSELFLGDALECTFIEPFPERLLSLVRPADVRRHAIVGTRVQDVPVETFAALEANDVLFIDSSHVSKIGSDVNYLLGDVLPALRPGVYVHFHDIFYPFEYPAEWLFDGRYWTEAYLLRAFLEFNRTFGIVLFNHFIQRQHRSWLERHMPLCARDTGGSIWLRRTA